MSVQSPLIEKAKRFRADKAAGVKKPSDIGVDCVADAADLAKILAEDGGETDTFLLAAAILHDLLQVSDTTEGELAGVFGSEIAFIIAEVTDNPRFNPVTRKALRLLAAPQMSRKARLIKLAEVIGSVRMLASPLAPAPWSDQHKREYFDWAERLVELIGKTSPTLQAVFAAEIEAARLVLGSRRATAG